MDYIVIKGRRIALCNRSSSYIGGDATHLHGYQKALLSLGHCVDFCPTPIQTSSYDEAWVFHVNFRWSYEHFLAVRKFHIPFRVFAIYYHRAYDGITSKEAQEVLSEARLIYCLSDIEKGELLDGFPSIEDSRLRIIDNGVDKSLFHKNDKVVDRKFVLSVGRFIPAKGHLQVIRACNELNLPVKVVGITGGGGNSGYENLCRKEASQNNDSEILCDLSQDKLAEYYQSSKVIVCASIDDRNNLSILEGVSCGATPVDSIYNRAYSKHNFLVANPTNLKDLMEKIKLAWDSSLDFSARVKDWDEVVTGILNDKFI